MTTDPKDGDPYAGDEERTPRQRPPIPSGRPSDTKLLLARAAALLNSFATELARAGGQIDQLPAAERSVLLAGHCEDGRGVAAALYHLMNEIEDGDSLPGA